MSSFLLLTGCLLVLHITRCVSQNPIKVFADSTQLTGNNHLYSCRDGITLVCQYTEDRASYSVVEWVKYMSNDQPIYITGKRIHKYNFALLTLNITINEDRKYACQYQGQPVTAFNLTIKLSSNVQGCIDTVHPSVTASNNIITTTSPTSSPTSTPTGSTQLFAGVNPLIYTSISAVFLGILTIVAIITCWLRSRKNVNIRQPLLPRDSPLDYLDYIQEGQFTPLTTSEFLASLSERPPTYNESQDIEQQMRLCEQTDENATPPPLPPRNEAATTSNTHRNNEPLGNLVTELARPTFHRNRFTHEDDRDENREPFEIISDTTNLLAMNQQMVTEIDESGSVVSTVGGVVPSLSNAVV